MPVTPDLELRAAVYRQFVERARAPTIGELAQAIGWPAEAAIEGLKRLAERRMVVLADDGVSIAMALPFSGVETTHVAQANGRQYYANCAWDAFGIPAALHAAGEVRSRCAGSGEPLTLRVGTGPVPGSTWIFHAAVPAVRWWRDIFYT